MHSFRYGEAASKSVQTIAATINVNLTDLKQKGGAQRQWERGNRANVPWP